MKSLKSAIFRATKWLRENPDKHIKTYLAKDANGWERTPNDPAATCFCAAGRVLKELNLSGSEDLPRPLDYIEIYDRNDGNLDMFKRIECKLDRERKAKGLGQVCALDYLDEVAHALPD